MNACCTVNAWPFSIDFIQMAKNFDDCRRKWANTEQELGSCKEILTKTETERGALEVKLKHARNQVDIEIRRRQKAETECEKMVRGISCWLCVMIRVDEVDLPAAFPYRRTVKFS